MIRQYSAQSPPWRNVTLGNIINLLAVLAIGIGFYWRTTIKIEEHDLKIVDIVLRFDKRETDTKDFREKLFYEMQRRADRDTATDVKLIERLTAVEVEIKGLRGDINRLDSGRR